MKTSVFKKATALLLAFMMMFSLVVTAVSAADAATLTVNVDKDAYKPGETVTVTVTASGLNAKTLGITFAYDNTALEIISGAWAVDALMKDYNVADNRGVMTFTDAQAIDGDLFTLVLLVKEGVEDGDYAVTANLLKDSDLAATGNVKVANVTVCDHANANVAFDDAQHWKECECGEKFDFADHAFDNDCDTTCDCGYTRTIEHVWGEFVYDEVSHWKECACGEKAEVAAHVFENDCDTTCDCGYTRDIEHKYETKFDANGHWTECACGDKTAVNPHVFGEWVIDTEATDTATGAKHRDCACGYTESKVTPKLMKFASATLTFESSITINFKVKPEYFDFNKYGYTDHYVVFTFEDDYGVPYDTVVTEYRVENPGTSSERYVYEFNGVKAFQMTTPVTATLYGTYEGEIYAGKPQPYSVQQYCSNQLSKSANAEFKGLLVHFLDYGTAAQEEWDIRLDNLANSVVTDAHRAFCNADVRTYSSITDTKYKDIDNEIVTWKSATLLFQDAIVIRLRLTATDMTGISCKVTSGDGREWIIENEDITWNASAARYEIHFDGLYAFDLSTAVYFTMMKDGVEVSDTLSYSVESYVAGKITGSQAALLKAMMMYGDSAAIYFK